MFAAIEPPTVKLSNSCLVEIARRLGSSTCVSCPQVAPVCTRRVFFAGSSSRTCLSPRMSIMMPPSRMDCPRALWPAPRIETLSLFCAAYLTTACNAASVFGRAICATFAWTMRPQSVMSRPETMGKSAGMPFTVALLFPPIWGIAPVHRTVLAGATFGQRIRRPRPTSRGIAAAMLLEELQQTGEDVDVTVLAHEHVLMAVVRKHVQLVAAGNDFLQTLVAHDVRVGEHMVLLAGHEQDRRVDVLGIVHIVVGERFVFGIPPRVLHRAVREHHLH